MANVIPNRLRAPLLLADPSSPASHIVMSSGGGHPPHQNCPPLTDIWDAFETEWPQLVRYAGQFDGFPEHICLHESIWIMDGAVYM